MKVFVDNGRLVSGVPVLQLFPDNGRDEKLLAELMQGYELAGFGVLSQTNAPLFAEVLLTKKEEPCAADTADGG